MKSKKLLKFLAALHSEASSERREAREIAAAEARRQESYEEREREHLLQSEKESAERRDRDRAEKNAFLAQVFDYVVKTIDKIFDKPKSVPASLGGYSGFHGLGEYMTPEQVKAQVDANEAFSRGATFPSGPSVATAFHDPVSGTFKKFSGPNAVADALAYAKERAAASGRASVAAELRDDPSMSQAFHDAAAYEHDKAAWSVARASDHVFFATASPKGYATKFSPEPFRYTSKTVLGLSVLYRHSEDAPWHPVVGAKVRIRDLGGSRLAADVYTTGDGNAAAFHPFGLAKQEQWQAEVELPFAWTGGAPTIALVLHGTVTGPCSATEPHLDPGLKPPVAYESVVSETKAANDGKAGDPQA